VKSRIRFTPELRQKVDELRSSGLKRKDISSKLSIPLVSVHRILKGAEKLSHEARSQNAKHDFWPAGTTEKILELRASGLTKGEVVEALSSLGVTLDKVLSDIQRSKVRLTKEQWDANRARKYEEDQKQKVLELRGQGAGFDVIEEQTGVPYGSARAFCGEKGIVLTEEQLALAHQKTDPATIKEALSLRNRKASFKEISTKLGVPWGTVKTWCLKNRVVLSKSDRLWSGFATASDRYQFLAERMGGQYLGPFGEVGTLTKARWRCREGHEFETVPQCIVSGHWCPRCSRAVSKSEVEVFDFVKELAPDALSRDRSIIGPKELDVYIPSLKLGIEYHGLYWHGEICSKDKKNVLHKHGLANEAGVRLIVIFEDEWLSRRVAVENYLRGLLCSRDRIGARKLTIRKGRFKAWVEENHLQGSANGADYALCNGDDLLALATFSKPNASRHRKPQEGVWELARYCVGKVGVTGGLSRLISAFREDHPELKELLSYSDNRWSQGKMYEAAGFDKVRVNRPSYWYFKHTAIPKRIHRFSLRKSVLVKQGGDPNKTEWQLAQEAGYDRIWDAGTVLWSKKF
jgi:hypothetical protein